MKIINENRTPPAIAGMMDSLYYKTPDLIVTSALQSWSLRKGWE
jgi:hypothetical protein